MKQVDRSNWDDFDNAVYDACERTAPGKTDEQLQKAVDFFSKVAPSTQQTQALLDLYQTEDQRRKAAQQ